MFKVLVLAYYFPPMGLSGVQRTLKFVKYMRDYNWEPTVITCGNSAYYAHDMSLLKEVEENNIRTIRTESYDINSVLKKKGTVKMPPEFLRKFASRLSKTVFIPDNKISWSNKAYKKAKELLQKEQFDMLFVTMPPFSVFSQAVKLKEEFNIPLFVDYRDLWTGNQFSFNPTPYHTYKHKSLEDAALRKADKIVVVNRKIKEQLILHFPFLSFDDIIIIPHGYDSEDFRKISPIPWENNRMQLTYSGIFYEMITPKYFLKAFRKLKDENPEVASDIDLNFVGHFRRENHKLAKRLKIEEHIKDYGYLDHKDSVKKIISSDVLWMMIGKSKNTNTITAGKLFEYFGSRKPIIACLPDGASKDAAKEYGCSYITEPDNINEIKNAILQAYNDYKSNSFPKLNEEFVQKHDRKFLTQTLTNEFHFYLKEEV